MQKSHVKEVAISFRHLLRAADIKRTRTFLTAIYRGVASANLIKFAEHKPPKKFHEIQNIRRQKLRDFRLSSSGILLTWPSGAPWWPTSTRAPSARGLQRRTAVRLSFVALTRQIGPAHLSLRGEFPNRTATPGRCASAYQSAGDTSASFLWRDCKWTIGN